MEISSKQILKVLYILSWIIFIGLCVEAGGVIFNTIFTLFINPNGARTFWKGMDLSKLYEFDKGYFIVMNSLIGIVAILKSTMFYLIVKVLQEKKLDMAQPFNKEIGKFIFNLCYLALGIGVFSQWAAKYSMWLDNKGILLPSLETLSISGADVWLFMAVILFVIAHIFKRGIEIQAENELTV